jgi:hypothetical protein
MDAAIAAVALGVALARTGVVSLFGAAAGAAATAGAGAAVVGGEAAGFAARDIAFVLVLELGVVKTRSWKRKVAA